MPDDENYQINQHPRLVLTVITPAQAPDTDVMSLSRSNVQCGPPGLPRADPTQAVVAGRSLSGRNYNSPPHRLSTLHWEHYPHRILRHYWCLCLALASDMVDVGVQLDQAPSDPYQAPHMPPSCCLATFAQLSSGANTIGGISTLPAG